MDIPPELHKLIPLVRQKYTKLSAASDNVVALFIKQMLAMHEMQATPTHSLDEMKN